MTSPRTALVTGASSGIGLATAKALTDRGYDVIGTSRTPDQVDPAAQIEGVRYLALDLADPCSIEQCAAEAGAVDVLVNNAGESQIAPLEEQSDQAVRRLFELNVHGPVRHTQLLAGGMRERGYGRVVMVGSMLASFPVAFRSAYVASKAAIKGFATASRYELSPYGVWLTTVEPGAINTGISQRRTKYIDGNSTYHERYHTVLTALDRNEARGIGPGQVAATIVDAIDATSPKPLYAVGSRAPLAFALKRALPAAALEQLIARTHGLGR